MYGAIMGDLFGSTYEFSADKYLPNDKDFDLWMPNLRTRGIQFTDDTYLILSTIEHLLTGSDIIDTLHKYFYMDMNAGYGYDFIQWCLDYSRTPYGSNGNGAALRVIPVGLYFRDLKEALDKSEELVSVTHNTDNAINGAKLLTEVIFRLKQKETLEDMLPDLAEKYDIEFNYQLKDISRNHLDTECMNTVIASIQCVRQSVSTIDAIKNAILVGGDTDTRAAISGSIAEVLYNDITFDVIEDFKLKLDKKHIYLPDDLWNNLDAYYESLA